MQKKQRKLYKIGHLTKLLGITPRTIRYYDQFGILPHVKRSEGGIRLFDDEDIEIIQTIRRLQKEQYLPLDVIKEKLFGSKRDQGEDLKAIVTDSTASLPSELITQLDIDVVPLSIFIGEKSYLDGVNITPKSLWEKCNKSSLSPKVSPPSVEQFVNTYQTLAKKGHKEIYSLHLSSRLSETYENAKQASYQLSGAAKVTVIDTKSAGAGLGLLVKLMAEAIHSQNSSKELQVLLTKNIPMIHDIITASSLRSLYYGPEHEKELTKTTQIDPRTYILKQIDSVNPVLKLNHKSGYFDLITCCQNKEEAIKNMLDEFESEIEQRGGYLNQVSIMYGYMYGEALEMINQIRQTHPTVPIHLHEGSAVLSSYVGPESVSISFV